MITCIYVHVCMITCTCIYVHVCTITCIYVHFRLEDANKSFSAAVQLHDGLVKAWALWGDFLDQLFNEDR